MSSRFIPLISRLSGKESSYVGDNYHTNSREGSLWNCRRRWWRLGARRLCPWSLTRSSNCNNSHRYWHRRWWRITWRDIRRSARTSARRWIYWTRVIWRSFIRRKNQAVHSSLLTLRRSRGNPKSSSSLMCVRESHFCDLFCESPLTCVNSVTCSDVGSAADWRTHELRGDWDERVHLLLCSSTRIDESATCAHYPAREVHDVS